MDSRGSLHTGGVLSSPAGFDHADRRIVLMESLIRSRAESMRSFALASDVNFRAAFSSRPTSNRHWTRRSASSDAICCSSPTTTASRCGRPGKKDSKARSTCPLDNFPDGRKIAGVGLIEGHDFDDDQCLALLGRSQLGRIALSLRAMPVVVPVRYVLQGSEPYFALMDRHLAEGASGSVVGLQADGYDEDSSRRWTVLAIGLARSIQAIRNESEVVAEDDPPLSLEASIMDPEVPRQLLTPPSPVIRHIFHLDVRILSGGWLEL